MTSSNSNPDKKTTSGGEGGGDPFGFNGLVGKKSAKAGDNESNEEVAAIDVVNAESNSISERYGDYGDYGIEEGQRTLDWALKNSPLSIDEQIEALDEDGDDAAAYLEVYLKHGATVDQLLEKLILKILNLGRISLWIMVRL